MVEKIRDSLKKNGIKGMTHDKKSMYQAMKHMKSSVAKRRG